MDEDWKVDANNGSDAMSGGWREIPSRSDFYHYLLIEWDELEVPNFLDVLLDWVIAGARTGASQFFTPSVV